MATSLLYIIILFITTLSPAHAEEPQLNADNQKDFVSDVLPYGLDFVHARIESEFNSDDRAFYEDYNGVIYQLPDGAKTIADLSPAAYRKFMAFPLARANKFYVFYGAYPNMQGVLQSLTPYAVMGKSNEALQRYAKLPQPQRANDIYLWSPDAPYWYSEYSLRGHPVPFHTYFIVHLAAVDDSHTMVELIEDQPTVQMGKALSVDAHGVVHHFDIRDAEPTTGDREFMLSCIRQFIDRKVPGRHYFNCKTAEELAEPPAPSFSAP